LLSKFVNNANSNFCRILKWEECEKSPGIDIHPAVNKFTNENNILKIYLCGADIDAYVLSSVYEGFDLGYDIEILKDFSLSSFGPELYCLAIKIIKKNLEQLKI
jgi:nicotinamidase-related amidase